MEHTRLFALPRTRQWDQVVELLTGGADASDVAAASLHAAEGGFSAAANDDGLAATTWLLTQLPAAARSENYVERLRELGLPVSSDPSLFDLIAAFTDAVDNRMRRPGSRTDLGEMAQMAATEALTRSLTGTTKSLFGTPPEDVRRDLAKLGSSREFAALSRTFFSEFTRRYLSFFLSRELSNHVGGDRRFTDIREHESFNEAISVHCHQAARIVEEFAGGWFSKANWKGPITPELSQRFVAVALKKIAEELRRGAGGSR